MKNPGTSIVDDIKKELTASVKQFEVEASRNIVNMAKQIESLEAVVDNAAKLTSIAEIISDSTNKIVDSLNVVKQELDISQKIKMKQLRM